MKEVWIDIIDYKDYQASNLGKIKHLGTFNTKIEAYNAYLKASNYVMD
jgi:hypothetical protein